MRVTVERRVVRLVAPLRAAWGELAERELLEVRLDGPDGVEGRGEAAPLEPYDGVPTALVRSALDAYANVLAAAPPDAEREELVAACLAERAIPQALAAIDMALWDIEARRAGVPVAALLHPRALSSIPVGAMVAAGFGNIKVKVGVGDDAGRVAAVRAAVGHGVALRVDANGAWQTADEALANLQALAPCDLELAEEPVSGVEEFSSLRARSPVPIAMDETAEDLAALGAGAAHYVCLKVSRCGGITGLLRAATLARAAGSNVYVGSTLDGPLGIAAGLHAAAALGADDALPACGLATLARFDLDPGPLAARHGAMAVPAGPGLL